MERLQRREIWKNIGKCGISDLNCESNSITSWPWSVSLSQFSILSMDRLRGNYINMTSYQPCLVASVYLYVISIKTLKNQSFVTVRHFSLVLNQISHWLHLRSCPSTEKRFICNERFPTLFLFLFIDRLHITSYLPYRSCCIYRTDKVLQFFCFPIIWMCTERLISLLEMPIVRWSIN